MNTAELLNSIDTPTLDEYAEWKRADWEEYLTDEAARRLGWDPQAVAQYFNFSTWETLPDDDQWDTILDKISDIETEDEDEEICGNHFAHHVQTIIEDTLQ